MIRVHLDFESRSKADIWSCGAYRYSQDPSTEVLCLAYCIGDGEVQIIPRDFFTGKVEDSRARELLAAAKDPMCTFVAHNAFFEQCIWKNILVPRYGFPEIPFHRWECTASKALAHGLPKALKDVAKVLNLAQLKDEEGKRIMLKMSKPRKPTKNDPSEWHESPEDFEVLCSYCKQDVEVERAVDKALPDLCQTEKKVWQLDQWMNMNGVRVDLDLVDKALGFATEYSEALNKRLHDLTDGDVEGCTKRLAMMKWLEKNGYPMKDLQAATVRSALANDTEMPDIVRKVLNIKIALGKSSVSKYAAFKESTCEDGRLRDILVYHSASTGRWGGKIVQLQNLPRGSVKYTDAAANCMLKLNLDNFKKLYPDVMGTLSSCIRSVLIPDEGKSLFVADYSSIEARVIAWLAGEKSTLEAFEKGECVYCKEATSIFGRPITKKDKFERSIGKVAVLALGYQGGIGAFGQMAHAYEIDLDPVYDIMSSSFTQAELESAQYAYEFYYAKVSEPLNPKGGIVADIIKQRWRRNNPKVVELWTKMENAAIEAVRTGKAVWVDGKTMWFTSGQFLYCELPSHRRIAYHKPEIRIGNGKEQLTYMTLLSQTKQYVRTAAYGGKLVENITQAVARDIMANALLNIKDKGIFTPHLTVHDEIITSGPDNADVKELEKQMCTLPYWAAGLPITAEGWKGMRYKK